MFLYKRYEIARHVYFKKNAYARFQEVRSLIDRLFQHIISKKEMPVSGGAILFIHKKIV